MRVLLKLVSAISENDRTFAAEEKLSVIVSLIPVVQEMVRLLYLTAPIKKEDKSEDKYDGLTALSTFGEEALREDGLTATAGLHVSLSAGGMRQLLRPAVTIISTILVSELERLKEGVVLYERDPTDESFRSIHVVNKVLQESYGNNTLADGRSETPGAALLDLFQDQDNDLVQALLTLQRLWIGWSALPDGHFSPLPPSWHPHQIIMVFLSSIGCDHLVLLDFLISGETHFVEYLLHYLRFATKEPPEEHLTSTTLRDTLFKLMVSVEQMHAKDLFPYNAAPLIKRMHHFADTRPPSP